MEEQDILKNDFSGKWKMTYGYHMIVVQIENQVTGKFYHSSNPSIWGTVRGSVKDSTLIGIWEIRFDIKLIPDEFRPGSNKSPFEITLSEDGKTFDGHIEDKDKATQEMIERDWHGDRLF